MKVQRHAIGKHHGSSRLKHVGTAQTNHAIGITDKTLAHNQAGFMDQCIFDRGHIDTLKLLGGYNTGGADNGGIFKQLICKNYNFFDTGDFGVHRQREKKKRA